MKAKKRRGEAGGDTFLVTEKRLGFSCIAEEDYAAQMESAVEPYLRNYVVSGSLGGLYYEFFGQPSPRETIVICFGLSEFCEKFHELAYYMHREGYQVAVWDHRGHGKSPREVEDPQLVHVERFAQYVEDMHRLMEEIVLPRAQAAPLYLYAHSMGGCIGTLYLEQYPGIFQKAVLNAPMYGLNSGGLPDCAAQLLCLTAAFLGKKKKKLFVMGDFDPWEPFERSGCDSMARHAYYQELRREHKEYQACAATYGWTCEAIRAGKRAISAVRAARIDIPVLLFQATEDVFVRAGEQDLFLARIPNGRKVIVRSRHEISRAVNGTLEPYLAEIFEFLGSGSDLRRAGTWAEKKSEDGLAENEDLRRKN